ncbi:flavin reductase family protein [Paraburkholderia lycopersici]|uniref:NADH-FMN oxidoreductase RutF, flavin reductase (DIM6/NTAB) family n=1 Tax=Paraburkholderia lycopersici TaxID=416944 RepID=A0A1G6PIA7_9BURK|nr:flavin reductase family protein [Paraburkholderia lycopersici]SDC79266.1 NADH-FMN oxidoreductase RutF, flavin reductase (DIM6/NTAB) family [Paraburkholderia lycopersici]
MSDSHVLSEPAILYFGTPVVLIGTRNEDRTDNIAPISSAFWLGWRCVIGIAASSKTTENLIRTGECVLNLPSRDEAAAVDRIACTTGRNPVPSAKRVRGYVFEPNKFERAGLTPIAALTVDAPRVRECPVQMESVLAAQHGIGDDTPELRGTIRIFELRVVRIHVRSDILMVDDRNRIDPDKWNPLIMSFQKFYGLSAGQVHESRLAGIPETAYRSPDVDRARAPQGT